MVKRFAMKAAIGALVLAAVIGVGAASAPPASARVIIGVGIGPFGYYPGPWAYPYPYYPYPYYPAYPAPYYAPAYGGPAYDAPGYDAPPAPAAAPAQQPMWYYCANPSGYYPYIQQCGAGWRQVPARPQPQP